MSVNAKIKKQIQKLQVGELITLYEIDTSIYGGGIYYFAPYTDENCGIIYYGGQPYIPLPAKLEGYTLKGDGSLSRPTLTVGNIDRVFNSILESYKNLNGCRVIIKTTFRQFLDNGTDPDTTAQAEPQVYRIHQKIAHNKTTIQWELAAMIDNQRIMIPRNVVAAEKCIAHYRIWNASAGQFTYNTTGLACPYTGTSYFTELGVICGPSLDVCSKDLYGCRLRYASKGAIIPYMQFSSIDRG